ncbi:serine hydrolase domain-containing protein [Acinetobacter baumannii]|uniref:serine hydrolase domain-containing protein n=1 Tax=Acinetobacter baumannii TaxID=470 RepID=UPI0008DDC440|nr:serine hydrolase domain-containing protein [Acinetobacter baumannii]MCQ1020203.1 beta-lactamase family protein [Acinetobacter baumannii]MDA4903995.1 serine hydrolase [Acinetobacter baumannii]OIB59596.1 esterase [Acinetobacter baumannii]OIB78478.1 esterase [Acinetobacter baumannii]OIF35870.1 esterase [Acinetobacter baumannii]
MIKEILLADTHNYHGILDERFIDLAHQFSRLQDARTGQGGAALAVYFRGQKVVDIYTGLKSQTEAWQPDTLAVCYSTGKGVLATLAHILISEGFLEYDKPIATYWPEFVQNGKEQMTLRHVLSHQSGMFDVRNIIESAREMLDWSHMLDVVAATKPRFLAGEGNAYQALTFGWLVGGVLEKATGQSLDQLMQKYLVEPLQLDGAYFGTPANELDRVARLMIQPKPEKPASTQVEKPKKPQTRKSSLSEKVITWTGQDPQDFQDAMIPKGMKNFSFFSDEGLQAVIPAANGTFTVNSLAKIYAMLANQGEWDGQQLIRPEVFKELSTIQSYARDRVMPIPMNWRLGYHRIITMGKRAKNGFGHIGYNGSGAWCDPERDLSFAYTHNFQIGSITGDYRLWGLTQEALRCTDQILKGRKGWF